MTTTLKQQKDYIAIDSDYGLLRLEIYQYYGFDRLRLHRSCVEKIKDFLSEVKHMQRDLCDLRLYQDDKKAEFKINQVKYNALSIEIGLFDGVPDRVNFNAKRVCPEGYPGKRGLTLKAKKKLELDLMPIIVNCTSVHLDRLIEITKKAAIQNAEQTLKLHQKNLDEAIEYFDRNK